MNFKLKALTVAAVAAMSLSGAANAIPLNNMFLVAYDTALNNSFVADLGFAASTFTNTTLATPITFTGNSNWDSFIANSTAANRVYQVLGYDGANNMYTTSSDMTTPGATSKFNLASGSFISGGNFFNFLNNNTGATNYVASTAAFGKASEIGSDWNTSYSFTTTAALGANDNFYKITKPAGAKPSTNLVLTTYTGDTTANSYWNLSTAGVLSFTAPSAVAAVPEADTSAMMLAGLGLMGFVARRRKNS